MSAEEELKRTRLETDAQKLEFVFGVLENCKFDLMYHNKLKMPLNKMEKIYFEQSVNRIEAAMETIKHMHEKKSKRGFLDKLLGR